jgi:hypothetical protein
LRVGFKADTLAAMKKLLAVCVLSILAVLSATNFALAATNLPAGSAKGSLTFDGATAELKFAAAFVDQKDERKPVVLVISDQKTSGGKMGERIRHDDGSHKMERSRFLSRQRRTGVSL